MKRNLILTIAVTFCLSLVATAVAQAADVSFSGQFRPRYNFNEDFTGVNNSGHHNFTTRARLNAKANVNANTSVFLQFQSVGTWGGVSQGGDGANDTRSSTGDATSANDRLSDVGFHQAFVTLKNVWGQGVDAKIGRQQVVLDGHRLFGHTGWTDGAESKDAIRLTHAAGNHTINYVYIGADNGEAFNSNTSDRVDAHVVHVATKGIMGGALSGIFVAYQDDKTSTGFDDNGTFYTIGARQKGKAGGLDYRVEYYHQFGEGSALASTSSFSGAYAGDLGNVTGEADMDAYMFGARIGKTFKNAGASPTITLWYDYLSGTDDSDISNGDWGTFHTLYDTGHKFYGFMDVYLGASGGKTEFMGLQDYAVKTKWKLGGGNLLKADYHHFRTATDLTTNATLVANMAKTGTSADPSPDLGSELDLTLVHKYDSNTKVVVGFSRYWSAMTLAGLRNGGNNQDADWAYVMVDTKF